jgi:L-lactate dehydrogenase complex protein LldE
LPPSSVALFVTCLGDTLFPTVGRATVTLLERLGVSVEFPREQTCCGQMHLNAGYADDARALGDRMARVFAAHEQIVSPSASCTAHVREHVPALSGRVYELSELLVDQLGAEEVGARYRGSVTYHPSCHSLRSLRLGDRPLRLLRAVRGLELKELPDAAECCGFGGTFAVKNASVSSAMLADKLSNVVATRASAVCACDSSCLMQIGGGLARRREPVRTLHLAEILA